LFVRHLHESRRKEKREQAAHLRWTAGSGMRITAAATRSASASAGSSGAPTASFGWTPSAERPQAGWTAVGGAGDVDLDRGDWFFAVGIK